MATAAKQQQQTTVVHSVSVSTSSSSSSSTSTSLPLQHQHSPTGEHTPKIHHINHRSTSPSLSKRSSPTSTVASSGFGSLKSQGIVAGGGAGAGGAHGNYISRSSPVPIETNDEEVESIAKQISDHAEAIYQTWKARGLAPTEILNCHTTSEVVAFGKTLTPPNIRNNIESPVVEFLSNTPDMSNNNLEKLVSSFVNEDKARQQAARKSTTSSSSCPTSQQNSPTANSILTSGTIRDALKKFESNNGISGNGGSIGIGIGNTGIGYVKPNFLISKGYTTPKSSNLSSQQSSPTQMGVGNVVTTTTNSTNNIKLSSPTSQLSINVPDVLIDSINTQQQQQQQQPNAKQMKSPKSSTISNNTTSIISGGLIKAQQQKNQNHKNSSNSVPVMIGGRISPTSHLITTQSTTVDDIDSNISNSTISNNSNSSTNCILNNSSNTTSITSNLLSKTKPQTPAKPANLLNHQPSWPNKNRNATTVASTIQSKTAPQSSTTTTAMKLLKDSSLSPTTPTAATPIAATATPTPIAPAISNKSNISNSSNSKLIKQTEQIKSVVIGSGNSHSHSHSNSNKNSGGNNSGLSTTLSSKKSADLLDEVTREEERLINALKTGIVLNNNHNNHLINNKINHNNNNLIKNNDTKFLPEVIQSTLTENKKSLLNNSGSAITNKKQIKQPITSSANLSTSTSTPIATTTTTTATTTTLTPTKLPGTIPTSSGSLVHQKPCADDKPNPMDIIESTGIIQNSINSVNSTGTATTIGLKDIMSPAPTPIKTKMRPKNDAAVPHPEQKSGTISLNSNYTNSRTNNTTLNPVRPFLTRGSVAERVMMFEKCPDVKAPMRNINREPPRAPKIHSVPKPEPQSHTTLQRAVRASNTKNVYIPRFHYPHGKPIPNIAQETIIQRVKGTFDSFPNNCVSKDDFPQILKICGLPHYWRMPFIACTQIMAGNLVDGYRFVDFWKQMSVYCHDIESRFVYILSRGQRSRPYILPEDLAPLVQDVVDNHPGLAFLKEACEFHSRYVHTVIARIFYSVNRSWSGRITVAELRRSNLIQVIQLLEDEEDINQIMAFFSYEHFYVIYCKFWELDRDHDLFIDQSDLARHNDHALSTRIIERIFSGCVTRGGKSRIMGPNGPKMSYTDFVWFLLSEEDKTNPTSIEYWFRCMDLDGDGIISMYELEYFYEEQQQRMESIGIETLPYEDCLCQMLDMIKPYKPGCVTLTDLKRCKMTPVFFDTFFNLEKYLEHEQRDPFASQRDNEEMSDWDRYAAQEYELLVAEEGGDTQGSYEEEEDDDYESNIDILESQLDDMSNMINEW